MGGGSRDNRDSGRFDTGDRGPRSFGDRDSRPRNNFDKPMFNAICDECGDNCTVPFEPRNGKPVLCSNCFAKKEGRGTDTRSFSPRPSASSNADLSELNAKLDKIIKLLTPQEPKNITEKIIETIEANSGKEVAPAKKKAKVASAKGGLSTKKKVEKE
jgi:CxxC-x17-CxxC domain-containing protein